MPDYTFPYVPNVEFTGEDVAVNREGRLTPKQENTVCLAYQTRMRDIITTSRWFLLFFAATVIVGVVIEYGKQTDSFDIFIARQWPIFMFVIIVLLVLLGISVVASYLLSRPLRDRRVSMVVGVAQVVVKQAYARGGSYMRYELHLRRGHNTLKLFRLANQQSLDFFQPGKLYRVYYVDYPQMPILLSAEHVT